MARSQSIWPRRICPRRSELQDRDATISLRFCSRPALVATWDYGLGGLIMRSVRRAVVVACTLVLGACTTEPYKDSISTFAKGISASQSALVKLDQRNNEIKRQQQLRAQPNLKLGPCDVGSGG